LDQVTGRVKRGRSTDEVAAGQSHVLSDEMTLNSLSLLFVGMAVEGRLSYKDRSVHGQSPWQAAMVVLTGSRSAGQFLWGRCSLAPVRKVNESSFKHFRVPPEPRREVLL
jgi:hypothetical protein